MKRWKSRLMEILVKAINRITLNTTVQISFSLFLLFSIQISINFQMYTHIRWNWIRPIRNVVYRTGHFAPHCDKIETFYNEIKVTATLLLLLLLLLQNLIFILQVRTKSRFQSEFNFDQLEYPTRFYSKFEFQTAACMFTKEFSNCVCFLFPLI